MNRHHLLSRRDLTILTGAVVANTLMRAPANAYGDVIEEIGADVKPNGFTVFRDEQLGVEVSVSGALVSPGDEVEIRVDDDTSVAVLYPNGVVTIDGKEAFQIFPNQHTETQILKRRYSCVKMSSKRYKVNPDAGGHRNDSGWSCCCRSRPPVLSHLYNRQLTDCCWQPAYDAVS